MEWISVKDRLPDNKYGSYLCCKNSEWIEVCYIDFDWSIEIPIFEYWRKESDDEAVYPTHWMPLPAPPTDSPE